LAELARLIGQTDPFEEFGRANRPAQPADERARHPLAREHGAPAEHEQPIPSWLMSANRGQPGFDTPRGAGDAYPEGHAPQGRGDDFRDNFDARTDAYRSRAAYDEAYPETDFGHGGTGYPPRRGYESGGGEYADHDRRGQGAPGASPYDDVLYGTPPGESARPRGGYGRYAGDAADPYGEPDYDEREAGDIRPRRGKMLAVVAVLVLAVAGTAGAYGYRHYVAAPRGGPPPVIKADNAPTKILPAGAPSGDGSSKPIQDRVGNGNAPERIVSREEQPVDVNQVARSEPRVVFPPLNQPNTNPVKPAERQAAAPPAFPPSQSVKTAADQPKRVRTVAIRGDQQEQAAPLATPAAPRVAPPSRSAPQPVQQAEPEAQNAPLQLSPQRQASARAQQQMAPASVTNSNTSAGGYVVQVSSQRSEQDAQASFRMLQGKFPLVLGSRSASIKRVDLGEKGIYYRAVVGPFAGPEDASRLCSDLKSAGGQCVVQRN
jgi:hypothetical protein